jgi:hypothetical protein
MKAVETGTMGKRRPKRFRLVVAALAPLILAVASTGTPEPALIQYGPARKLCDPANPAINESSGLACSRHTGEDFRTHNDSGDSVHIFAFKMEGENVPTPLLEVPALEMH